MSHGIASAAAVISQTDAIRPRLASYRRRALVVAAFGIALTAYGYASDHEQFFRSYLLAYVYWTGLAIGCLGLLMIHHLAGGRWGFGIRRLLEAGTRTLPVMFVLGLPVVLGMHELYEWTHADVVAADAVLQHKQGYLNAPFFVARAVLYFAIWGLLAFFLNSWSALQDATEETWPTRRLQVISGPGLVLWVLTGTFASIDWIMSLEPHWFSTIYSAIYLIGQLLLTWAVVVIVAVPLARHLPLSTVLTNERLRDLGTFMLGFVMLWAYVSFSQLLIIWSGNLPEEITWYYARLRGGWQHVGYALVLFHFAVPFLLLISSRIKARTTVLVAVATGLMVMRLVDLFWITAPAFAEGGDLSITWLDVAVPLALGGVWAYAFFGQLCRRPLLPLNDPRFDLAGVARHEESHG